MIAVTSGGGESGWKAAAPYVAAVVALLVGLLSALVSTRSTKRTLEQQRAAAREARLWEKRAETYVSLLKWSEQTRAAASEAQGRRESRLTEDEWRALAQMPTALHASVLAFGSDEVGSAVDRLRHVVPSRKDVEATTKVAFAGASLLLALDLVVALGDLTTAVRRELQLDNGEARRERSPHE